MQTDEAIQQFLNAKTAKNVSKHTLGPWRYRLRVFSRFAPSLPSDPTEIELFLSQMGPSPENRETYYNLIRNFYSWLKRRRVITQNPMEDVEAPTVRFKVARSLEPEALHQLLTYPGHRPAIRAFLYLLADTGVRLSEALSVDEQQFGAGTVIVSGKVGERGVPISDSVRQMLSAELPWPWNNYQTAGLAVRRAFRAAGFSGRKASAHTLRHTFARLWEGDESLLVGILGWTSPRMLKVYRPYNIKKAQAQHRVYTPIVGLTGPRQLALM